MVDIIPATDPRVRVELTFHSGKTQLIVDIPRMDYLPETQVRGVKAALRRITRDAEKQSDDIRRTFRRYQIEYKKYLKAFEAWEKRLDAGEDPGEEPEEPVRPEFDEVPDASEAQRTTALAMLREVVPAKVFTQLEKCSTAELVQAQTVWTAASAVPLGELLASPTSSTETTERPPSPTSSTEDGTDTTSEPDSPGMNSESS